MLKEVIRTWEIHNRINLYFLDGINTDDYLLDKCNSKGRSVGQQFMHLHKVRLAWLKEATPQLLEDLQKQSKEDAKDKSKIKKHLLASGEAVSSLIRIGFEKERIKGFKLHPIAFLGYLISHESHHRGQIMLSLKESDHLVSKQIRSGLWEWGV